MEGHIAEGHIMEGEFVKISISENGIKNHYFFVGDRCIYKVYSGRDAIKYLKCIEDQCRCNGKIVNDIFTRTNDIVHNHESHEHIHDFEVAYDRLRNAVRNDRRSILDLHKEAMRNLSLPASGLLAWDKCRHALQRIRRSQMPSIGTLEEMITLLEDERSEIYLTYGRLRETNFYQGAVEGHLVFANLELVGSLPEQFDIYLDATFGVVPFGARQLLVIMADLCGRPRPIIYAIMTGQASGDYKTILEFARDGIFSFDGIVRTPTSATCDFEQAIRLALSEVWPGIQIVGCNFHFCQALRRKARSLQSLSVMVSANGTIQHKILLMFMRLSLLPLDRVIVGLNAILNFITDNELDDDFAEFVQYFRNVWQQRYQIQTWCVSGRLHRTNNFLEGYNNKIKLSIRNNPSASSFLDSLLDLAYDASSKFSSDVQRNILEHPDRSRLTQPLALALQQLQEGVIDELRFLQRMSSV